VVLADWFVPDLGGLDDYGIRENEFIAIDCSIVRLMPDGTFEIEANVEGTSYEFHTPELPLSELNG